jgi:hypothetical protein
MDKEEEIQIQEPTFEEIKAIVDRKRPQKSKYSNEERLKNLEVAREKRKQQQQQQKLTKSPTVVANLEKLNTVEKPKEEIPVLDNNILLDEIRKLNIIQNQILETMNKPKPKPKRIRKAPVKTNTLDLTITDNEIKNIIEEKNIIQEPTKERKSNMGIQEAKVKALLDALTKK